MDLVARAERLTKEEARLSREREELKESMKQVTEKQKAQAAEETFERFGPKEEDIYQRCYCAEGENRVLREWNKQLQQQITSTIARAPRGRPGSQAGGELLSKRIRSGEASTSLPNKLSRHSADVEVIDMTGGEESENSFESRSAFDDELPEQDTLLRQNLRVPDGHSTTSRYDKAQQQAAAALSKSVPPGKAPAAPASALPTPQRSLGRPSTVRRPRDFGEVVQSVEDILPELDFLDEGSASGRSPATDLPQRVLTAFEPYLECHLTFIGEKTFKMKARSHDLARCAVARLYEIADHELPNTQREACEWCCKNNALCILVTRENRKLILPRPADERHGLTVRDAGY
ncbi:hypothetical protein LTR37_010648 [Vermiconidia calcicola]|uniref:Uncharacterized protein n=1 Tax=Vermiconidia calcicola TaxID=1690605 RepID=A0ACC3N5W5_9PEZI|nr:hypothetical protein LTR37_010648 [Vermiconidia calcicola]